MRNTSLLFFSFVILPSAFADLTPPRLTLEKLRPRLSQAVVDEAKKTLKAAAVENAYLQASHETVELGKYTEEKASFMGNSNLTFSFQEDGKYQELECESQITVLIRSTGNFHPETIVLLETDKHKRKMLVAYEPSVKCYLKIH